MKGLPRVLILLSLFGLLYSSCKKDKALTITTPTYLFKVGEKDSADYYDYEPDLEFRTIHNFDGYYINSDSLDLNLDNKQDFLITREGFVDNFISGNPNYFEFKIHNLNDYEIVCTNFNYADTLNLGDTLSNDLNWVKNDNYLLIYSSSGGNGMKGNWNIWGKEKYLGFRKIDNDTVMGWVRIELPSSDVALRIKDCAISR